MEENTEIIRKIKENLINERYDFVFYPNVNVEVLKGKTLKNVFFIYNQVVSSDHDDDPFDFIVFQVSENESYLMYHEQDCCESVYIEDVCGDIENLKESPILIAEERSNGKDELDEEDRTVLWTFYEFATIKGSVTIRWYGSSNGYYSERVSFKKLK